MSRGQSYLSQVKFSWAENNIKRRFVHHILVEDSPSAITNADNVALGQYGSLHFQPRLMCHIP